MIQRYVIFLIILIYQLKSVYAYNSITSKRNQNIKPILIKPSIKKKNQFDHTICTDKSCPPSITPNLQSNIILNKNQTNKHNCVGNECWQSLVILAKEKNRHSIYIPNVTSMNCTYTVPHIPNVYHGQSIFLWCGLQPGGGHGVIQPMIMFGPDCPEGFGNSKIGPYDNHTCPVNPWTEKPYEYCKGQTFMGDINYSTSPYFYWSAQYISPRLLKNKTQDGWVCGTGKLFKAVEGDVVETQMYYIKETDSWNSIMINHKTGEKSYLNVTCPDYICSIENNTWYDLIFEINKNKDGGKNMVEFIAETYLVNNNNSKNEMPYVKNQHNNNSGSWKVDVTVGQNFGKTILNLSNYWEVDSGNKKNVHWDGNGSLYITFGQN